MGAFCTPPYSGLSTSVLGKRGNLACLREKSGELVRRPGRPH